MHLQSLFTAALAALLFGTASIAHADDSPMSLRLDAETVFGTVDGTTITKADVGAGLALDVIPRITLFADLRIGMFRIGLDSALDDGLRGRGTIWSYADLAGRTGASVRLLDHGRWKLDLSAEYESSLVGIQPEISTFRIHTDEGRFDVTPYADRNAETHVFWNRAAAGLSFRAVFGRFTPGVSVAYQVVGAELDLHLTDDARETLGQLGYDSASIERRHSLTFWSVPITPELEYELSNDIAIGIEATIMPAGDSWLYGGGINFRHSL